MPMTLTYGDRRLVLGLGIIVIVLIAGVALLQHEQETDPGYPSSYSAHSKGAKAAYLTLQESGYPIERWREPPQYLPKAARGTVLIIAEPSLFPLPAERLALALYLANGGRVIAIGRRAERLLPENGAEDLAVPQPEWKPVPPAVPTEITRGGPITTSISQRWVSQNAGDLAHYSSPDGAVVISFSHGAGEVVWWAEATPITNAGIKEPGNLELLLNSIGPPGTRAYWDEFFHGSRQTAWEQISDTPVKWMIAQTLLLALALLFTFSRRSGPVQPLVTPSRLSPLEFVETLGGLYQRAHAGGFAVETAYGRFRYLLARRLGVQREISPQALAQAARDRLGCADPALKETLEQCAQAAQDTGLRDDDALRLVQRLSDLSRTLKLAR
ncbi:MAG: DUF4350 domain-containing protein [Terriglobales bacterium]|jgi:hypothetical protein